MQVERKQSGGNDRWLNFSNLFGRLCCCLRDLSEVPSTQLWKDSAPCGSRHGVKEPRGQFGVQRTKQMGRGARGSCKLSWESTSPLQFSRSSCAGAAVNRFSLFVFVKIMDNSVLFCKPFILPQPDKQQGILEIYRAISLNPLLISCSSTIKL